MKLADLDRGQLSQALSGRGLNLRTGPLVTRIRSDLTQVRDGLALHYAAHPVEPAAGFADFSLDVVAPRSPRRWIGPQVELSFDGQRLFAPLPRAQAFPMLEWGMNWCVSALAHQFLIVHAAVLERAGRALLLPAPSGAGKSTLCAALAFRGWRLVSDELALLDPVRGEVVPLPRPISLKNAAVDVLRRFAPSITLGPVVHGTLKGSVGHARPPADAVARADERPRPAWVVLSRYAAGSAARMSALPKAQALMRLVESAFNYNIHGAPAFELLADVVAGSDCRRFVYSRLDEAVAAFDRLADGGAPEP